MNQEHFFECITKKGYSINEYVQLLNEKKIPDDFYNQMEDLFRKVPPTSKLLGPNKDKMIEGYLNLFPKIKLPSGKMARCSPKNIEKAFIWFFSNYKYQWLTIAKATKLYLEQQRKDNYKFCRTSQYFIRKENNSILADYCEIVLNGIDIDTKQQTIKVV